MPICLLLLLTSVLLVSMESQINEVMAKKCTDNSNDNENISSSCVPHDESKTFTQSIPANGGKNMGVDDGVGDSLIHQNSEFHNHESSHGGSNKDTPFKLPFP